MNLAFVNFTPVADFHDQHDQFMIANFTYQPICAHPVTDITKVTADHQLAVIRRIAGLLDMLIQVFENLLLHLPIKMVQIFESRLLEFIIPGHVWLLPKSRFSRSGESVFAPSQPSPNHPGIRQQHVQHILQARPRLGGINGSVSVRFSYRALKKPYIQLCHSLGLLANCLKWELKPEFLSL